MRRSILCEFHYFHSKKVQKIKISQIGEEELWTMLRFIKQNNRNWNPLRIEGEEAFCVNSLFSPQKVIFFPKKSKCCKSVKKNCEQYLDLSNKTIGNEIPQELKEKKHFVWIPLFSPQKGPDCPIKKKLRKSAKNCEQWWDLSNKTIRNEIHQELEEKKHFVWIVDGRTEDGRTDGQTTDASPRQ